MKNISQEVVDAILEVNRQIPGCVICGSFGLVLNGYLDRQVGDLDVLTPYNCEVAIFEGELEKNRSNTEGHSQYFVNDGKKIKCVKTRYGSVKIDLMYNREIMDDAEFFEYNLKSELIKIEEPTGAVKAKLSYIKVMTGFSYFIKHLKDLLEMPDDICGKREIKDALEGCKIQDE